MDLLAISPPDDEYLQEAHLIVQLLDAGLLRYHIRKPVGSQRATESLIQAVPEVYHSRLSLHQHYELSDSYEFAYIIHRIRCMVSEPLAPVPCIT